MNTRSGKRKEKPGSSAVVAAVARPRTPRRTVQKVKVRNKVASPVAKVPASIDPTSSDLDVESDEFNYEDEAESKASGEASTSSVVSASSSKSRERLSWNLQRQLLTDIQNAGGLQAFHLQAKQALSLLCNKRPDIYGERSDNIRRRIIAKVARWRLLPLHEQLALLQKFNVTAKPGKTLILPEEEEESKPPAKKPPAKEQEKEEENSKIPATVSIPSVQPKQPKLEPPKQKPMSTTSGNTSKISQSPLLIFLFLS